MNGLSEKIKTHNKYLNKDGSGFRIVAAITLIMFISYEILNVVMFNKYNIFRHFGYILSPSLLILNLLPLVCAAFFLYCLCNSIKISTAAVSAAAAVFYTINEYKIIFRDEPLRASDIALAKEAAKITENYDIHPKVSVVASIILLAAFLIFAFSSFKDKKSTASFRIYGAAVSAAVMMTAVTLVYQNPVITENIPNLQEEYYSVRIAMKKGLPYYILSGDMNTGYKRPKGYSRSKAKHMLESYENEQPWESENINVISIMSESFFDPSDASNFRFFDDKYPLVNFQRMKNEGIYGDLNVHGFGGGTSATEFEFLTGANFYLASPDLADVYTSYIKRDIYALPRVFAEHGYSVKAMHPGHKWFYNRDKVYKHMGFDSFTAADDMDENLEKIHYYISDKETANLIINDYAQHLEATPDKGYFNFTVTIQNHGPYDTNPSERGDYLIRPEGISDELYNVLNNYMIGLSDADNMLGMLRTYLNSVDKPTVLVFFGDHLPYFDDEQAGFNALGYNINIDTTEGMVNKYKTPYLIWGNEAFKHYRLEKGEKIMYGRREAVSANYLANELFEYMGTPLPSYFKFTAEAKKSVSIIGSRYNVAGGRIVSAVPPEYKDIINKYKILQYYNIMDYKK